MPTTMPRSRARGRDCARLTTEQAPAGVVDGLSCSQCGDLCRDLFESPDDFLVPHRIRIRLFPEEREAAVRIQHRAIHFIERGKTLFVRRRLELEQADRFFVETIVRDASVLDEHVRVALDEPLDLV